MKSLSDKKKAQPVLANEGYSLIEILISIAIFAIGILGIAGLQVRATNSDTHSRLLTEAYTVATDQIEAIMLLPYNNAAISAGDHPVGNTGPANRYNLSYFVTDNPGAPSPLPPSNTKTIRVTVQVNQSLLPAVVITFVKALIQDL